MYKNTDGYKLLTLHTNIVHTIHITQYNQTTQQTNYKKHTKQ